MYLAVKSGSRVVKDREFVAARLIQQSENGWVIYTSSIDSKDDGILPCARKHVRGNMEMFLLLEHVEGTENDLRVTNTVSFFLRRFCQREIFFSYGIGMDGS